MTVRRFVGATARDCLRRAKEVLGADAVVISNRAVEGGVEIVAMSPESLNAISQQLRPVELAKQASPPSPINAPLRTSTATTRWPCPPRGAKARPSSRSPLIRPGSRSA
jgi:flagellar biosynthesis protein FlhF